MESIGGAAVGCELGRGDRGLEEFGELRKRSTSELLGLIVKFLLSRARSAPEQDVMESGEERS